MSPWKYQLRTFALYGLLGLASLPCHAATQTAVTDPQVVREHYEQVLAAPEYREKQELDFFGQFYQWFYSFLRSLNDSMSDFKYAPEIMSLSYFMMWIILILSFLGIIYWSGKLLLSHRMDGGEHKARPQGQRYFAPPESYEPEIQKAVSIHDWPAALQWSWRRLLSQLERNELVAADRTQTNWEYLAQLRQKSTHPNAPAVVTRLVQAYDRHIYGSHPLSPSDWENLNDEFQAIIRLLKLDRPTTPSSLTSSSYS